MCLKASRDSLTRHQNLWCRGRRRKFYKCSGIDNKKYIVRISMLDNYRIASYLLYNSDEYRCAGSSSLSTNKSMRVSLFNLWCVALALWKENTWISVRHMIAREITVAKFPLIFNKETATRPRRYCNHRCWNTWNGIRGCGDWQLHALFERAVGRTQRKISNGI